MVRKNSEEKIISVRLEEYEVTFWGDNNVLYRRHTKCTRQRFGLHRCVHLPKLTKCHTQILHFILCKFYLKTGSVNEYLSVVNDMCAEMLRSESYRCLQLTKKCTNKSSISRTYKELLQTDKNSHKPLRKRQAILQKNGQS